MKGIPMRSFQSQSLRASTVKSKGPTGSMKSVFLYLVFPALWGLAGTAMALENNFHLAVMDYFRVSEQQVTDAEQSGISEEELPVVFFIAQRTNLGPEAVTTVHSGGLNWMQVAYHFRLNPLIFYSFFTGHPAHAPLEKAYGEYKHRQNNFSLTDSDAGNRVNLKFLSEYYGRDPKEII